MGSLWRMEIALTPFDRDLSPQLIQSSHLHNGKPSTGRKLPGDLRFNELFCRPTTTTKRRRRKKCCLALPEMWTTGQIISLFLVLSTSKRRSFASVGCRDIEPSSQCSIQSLLMENTPLKRWERRRSRSRKGWMTSLPTPRERRRTNFIIIFPFSPFCRWWFSDGAPYKSNVFWRAKCFFSLYGTHY